MSDAILLPPVGSAPATAAAPLPATPIKIWGARVHGQAAVGDTIQISTASGKSWPARVVAVVKAGSRTTDVYATGLDEKPARAARGSRANDATPARYQPVRRARGRCEDAPCCGCCDVTGYGG